MKSAALCLPASLLVVAMCSVDGPISTWWTKTTVTGEFLTEGLSAGDIDGDGQPDLVAGAFWFKGPDFKERKAYRPGRAQPPDSYMEDSFLSWIDDLNGDGRNDILMAGRPGKEVTVYLNPGPEGDWSAHRILEEAATESPLYYDVDGDGRKDLVCMQGGRFGYARRDPGDATKPWRFTPVSEKRTDSPYVHGLGAGDLNGDGRVDILEKDGWFEQPTAPTTEWIHHPYPFAVPGGSQMLVFDADADGDNDVVTSLNGHGYGLAWFENRRTQTGQTDFVRHEILSDDPSVKPAEGIQFSQLHALEAADLDGDGRTDFVTGKRWWAHNGGDPGANDPAVTVAFLNAKDGNTLSWRQVLLDQDSGVGCQVIVADLDGDGKPEIAAGSKKGVHFFKPD